MNRRLLVIPAIVVALGTVLTYRHVRARTPEALLARLARRGGDKEELIMRINVARGDVITPIISAYRDTTATSAFRADLIELLFKRNFRSSDQAIEEVLLDALGEPDVVVRRRAVRALALYGTERLQLALVDCVRDSDEEIRRQAYLVLGSRGRDVENRLWKEISAEKKKTMIDACVERMKTETDPETRMLARAVVGREIEIRAESAREAVQATDLVRAEEIFRTLLVRERPDVVHFQHLIHSSVGLVEVARAAGAATVVTCHDYWALCPRVQLIRPDGRLCAGNMGSGCLLCVKERDLDQVDRARSLDRAGGELLRGLARDLLAEGATGEDLRRRCEEYLDLRARERVVPAAYAACDLRISPSRFLRELHLETGHFDPATFLFSDNGMRTDHVHALEKSADPGGRLRLGFVGSLVWYKGTTVLVEALGLLEDAPVVLNVFGSFEPERDPYHAELERAAGENVHFRGRFDNSRLSEVYAEIDVLVVPSIWFENSPITIHEAFLTHTPVVTSDIGGMAEYVRDGVDGLHFAVGDARDLARVLRRLTTEDGLLEELARDFPPVKTIAENAAEIEFRYRALCCRQRSAGDPLLRSLSARATVRRGGEVEEQGQELLLLRPGGAWVDYDLSGLPEGQAELSLEVLALGAEPEVELRGRLSVDGRELGWVPRFRSSGQDEMRTFFFPLEITSATRRLRVETTDAGESAGSVLRLAGVHLHAHEAGERHS